MKIHSKWFQALWLYKDQQFQLIASDENTGLLIYLMLPVLDDTRCTKYYNFMGGVFDYEVNGTKEKINLKGRISDVPFIYDFNSKNSCLICMDTNISSVSTSLK